MANFTLNIFDHITAARPNHTVTFDRYCDAVKAMNDLDAVKFPAEVRSDILECQNFPNSYAISNVAIKMEIIKLYNSGDQAWHDMFNQYRSF